MGLFPGRLLMRDYFLTWMVSKHHFMYYNYVQHMYLKFFKKLEIKLLATLPTSRVSPAFLVLPNIHSCYHNCGNTESVFSFVNSLGHYQLPSASPGGGNKPYRYVRPQRVWFWAVLVWNRVKILTILVWNRVRCVHSDLELGTVLKRSRLLY